MVLPRRSTISHQSDSPSLWIEQLSKHRNLSVSADLDMLSVATADTSISSVNTVSSVVSQSSSLSIGSDEQDANDKPERPSYTSESERLSRHSLSKKMRHYFPQIPKTEVCVADFTCALSKDMLLRQGRLYIGEEWVGFHSPVANTKVAVHVSQIQNVVPKTTMLLPTALNIETDTGVIHIMSLMFRDNAVAAIKTIMDLHRIHGRNSTVTLPDKNETVAPEIKDVNTDKVEDSVVKSPSPFFGSIWIFAGVGFLILVANLMLLYRAKSLMNQLDSSEFSL
ncbi:hypothetical protein BC833DRAFT_586743 [Globomyces pollinis-pini]|nr:hypothetical protein BC833DRAFT_586743 [Globomyces pollinis-pini]